MGWSITPAIPIHFLRPFIGTPQVIQVPSEEVPSKASASVKAGGPPPAFPSLEPESGKPKGFLGKPGNASPPPWDFHVWSVWLNPFRILKNHLSGGFVGIEEIQVVDASEILRLPVEVGSWNPSIYRVLYMSGGCLDISKKAPTRPTVHGLKSWVSNSSNSNLRVPW